MKYNRLVAWLLMASLGLASWTATAQGSNSNHTAISKEGTLIVYLSRTGNTQAIAESIQKEVGGTLVELERKTPYPDDYDAIVAQVVKEDETGYLPPLKTRIADFRDYDTVFLGFPTWNMQLPPPIRSFLKTYDLSGKTVIPFNTNGGYGAGSSFQEVKQLCPDSTVLKGFSTRGGLERDGIYLAIKGQRREEVRAKVAAWLRRIQILPRVHEEQTP